MNRKYPENIGLHHPDTDSNKELTKTTLDQLMASIPGIVTDGLVDEDGVLIGNTATEGIDSAAALSFVVQQSIHDLLKFARGSVESGEPVRDTGIAKEILARIKDRPLIDLGAGISDEVHKSAALLNTSQYIAVEPHHHQTLKEMVLVPVDTDKTEKPQTSAIIVAEDMLIFLKRLPDDCASIIASNIDHLVIGDAKIATQIGSEIDRVVGRKGVYFNNFSEIPMPAGEYYVAYEFKNSAHADVMYSDGTLLNMPKSAILMKEE